MDSDYITALENRSPKNAPFGYCWREGKLVPETSEFPVRKLMYELFLAHRRKKTVARLLSEAGCRTRSGALFSDTAVDRILRDASAKGVFHLNQNGKQRQIQIEPIISEEIWEEVNAILNDPQKLGKKAVQLFAGFVFCECGGKMNVPSNSPKYVCADCKHKIGTTDLEEIFCSQLAGLSLAAFQDLGADLTEELSESETLADLWLEFTKEEKRSLIEQLLKRIVAGKREIRVEFALVSPRATLKTAAFGQQQDDSAKGQQESQPGSDSDENFISSSSKPEILQRDGLKETNPYLPNLNEPLLNESEAARFLGISRMTLLRKRGTGEIKFFRVGFRVLYSKEKHLAPFLEKCEKNSSKE